MWDMTHSCVRHDSFRKVLLRTTNCQTWLKHTHSYWVNMILLPTHLHPRATYLRSKVSNDIKEWQHSAGDFLVEYIVVILLCCYSWSYHEWHDSFTRVTWLISVCNMCDIYMSLVKHMNDSFHTCCICKRVMSHIWMSHVTLSYYVVIHDHTTLMYNAITLSNPTMLISI